MNLAATNSDLDDDALQQLVLPAKKPYHHFESAISSTQIHFYLSQEIGQPYDYIDMMHRITTASPYDVIYIHLNTTGGRLDTGIQMINAMRNSPAKIITCLECNAFSLGTLIFLSGDEMIVNDNCMLMFHDYNGGTGGKGNEQVLQLAATNKWFTSLLKSVYVPFLTDDEVDRILRGEDIWMTSPEVKKRLNRMIKTLTENIETAKKPRVSKRKSKESVVISQPADPVAPEGLVVQTI
jgi:ATP-dependent protease ClpP protease subunit